MAPLEKPDRAIDAKELAIAVRERWPGARIGIGGIEGSGTALEALIPLVPAPRGMLPGRRGLHLIEPGSMRMVELTCGLSTAEVLARIT